MSDDAVQSLVNDDVAKALDSLADIDPAQPAGSQPVFDPMSTTSDPVGGMSIGSPPPPPPPAPDPSTGPISDVTGPGGLAMPSPPEASEMPTPPQSDMPTDPVASQPPAIDDMLSTPQEGGLAMPSGSAGVNITPPSEAVESGPEPEPAPAPEEPEEAASPAPTSSAVESDLDRIREEAATELAPLISSVEDPHERFDVAMSVAQMSNDDDGRTKMLGEALEAAKSIDDSKIKAEALAEILHNTHK